MQLKSILNRVQKHKAFVYEEVEWGEGEALSLRVRVRARAHTRPVCSGCGRARPGYDTLPTRDFEFVPLWGIAVFLVYGLRRVECKRCGVIVEAVPWATGKHTLTTPYMQFLAVWARRLSWSEVATIFQTSWEKVFHSVQWMVGWGLEQRKLTRIRSLGIDEVAWRKGHEYLTLVYQIDGHCQRLLWVGQDRTVKSLLRFFRWFGKARSGRLRFLCSDLWQPYLKVMARKAAQALHVLDRFHVIQHLNKAVDEVRAQEVRTLKAEGRNAVLTHTRWCLLKRPENLTAKQEVRLGELLRYNLKAVRTYLLKEDFQFFWDYRSPYWAGKFLDRWCTRALRSRLEPMKKVARMLRKHRPLLLNWFRAKKKISAGKVEGLNNRVKLTIRKAYGFRTFAAAEVALYHTLGALPEPEWTHKFC